MRKLSPITTYHKASILLLVIEGLNEYQIMCHKVANIAKIHHNGSDSVRTKELKRAIGSILSLNIWNSPCRAVAKILVVTNINMSNKALQFWVDNFNSQSLITQVSIASLSVS